MAEPSGEGTSKSSRKTEDVKAQLILDWVKSLVDQN